jgi:hypothetical protein
VAKHNNWTKPKFRVGKNNNEWYCERLDPDTSEVLETKLFGRGDVGRALADQFFEGIRAEWRKEFEARDKKYRQENERLLRRWHPEFYGEQ